MRADFAAVLLTMGRRPEELKRALDSLLAQEGITLDLVIVGNGWDPASAFSEQKTLHLRENLGIPAGRNAGAEMVKGEFLFFLDDDVLLHDARTLARMKELFRSRSEIGLIQPRVLPLDASVKGPKRWIPRLRTGDETKSSVATSLWEGATAIRSRLFNEIGGWPANFFYAHEGIELVWRVLDRGALPWYAADITVTHPVINPARHDYYFFLNARNRVWLAKRNLRFPFTLLYPLTWLIISIIRIRQLKNLKASLMGFFQGTYTSSRIQNENRRKLRWRTHFLLCKYGRPPII